MKLKVSPWGPRFWAWLIDFIVIWIVSAMLLFRPFSFETVGWGTMSVVGLIYWAVLESDGRQSIGKKALNLKVVDLKGKDITLWASTINAFGKSFLLPLDTIIGVLARPGKKQRLFSMASDTNVVKM